MSDRDRDNGMMSSMFCLGMVYQIVIPYIWICYQKYPYRDAWVTRLGIRLLILVSSLSVYFGFMWAPSLWQGCLLFPSCPHAEHVSPLHRLTGGLEGKTWGPLLEAGFGDQGHQ